MDNNQGLGFYYQSGAKELSIAFKRTIGMHLFKMRQEKRITRHKVCSKLNIKSTDLDNVEIGKGNISWEIINKLLTYYHVRLHLTLSKVPKPKIPIE